ncbi:MAG: hypothetical protein ACLPX1_09365 [Steroidobacteraceae bacterium]
MLAAAILLALGVGLVIGLRRWPVVYVVLSGLAGLMAFATVIKAFTADQALWPSESWRYGGAALNGVGALAAVFAIVGFVRWKLGRGANAV